MPESQVPGMALPTLGQALPVFVGCGHELVTPQPLREAQPRTACRECGQGSTGRQGRTPFAGAGGQWEVRAEGRALGPVSGVRTPAEPVQRARAVTQTVRRGPVTRFARGAAYLLNGKRRRRGPFGQADAERVPLGQDVEPDEPARREPHRAEDGQRDPDHGSADRTGHSWIGRLSVRSTVARATFGVGGESIVLATSGGHKVFPIIEDLHSSVVFDRSVAQNVHEAEHPPARFASITDEWCRWCCATPWL